MKAENHTFFEDLSSLLDSWDNLNTIYSLAKDSSNSDTLMAKLKDRATVDAFVDILKTIKHSKLINPVPQAGDEYEENENLYGLLEYVFSNTKDVGLVVERDTLRQVETPTHTWDNEFDAMGEILYFIANRDIINASSAFRFCYFRN